jgi:hypothetical protein
MKFINDSEQIPYETTLNMKMDFTFGSSSVSFLQASSTKPTTNFRTYKEQKFSKRCKSNQSNQSMIHLYNGIRINLFQDLYTIYKLMSSELLYMKRNNERFKIQQLFLNLFVGRYQNLGTTVLYRPPAKPIRIRIQLRN